MSNAERRALLDRHIHDHDGDMARTAAVLKFYADGTNDEDLEACLTSSIQGVREALDRLERELL